MNILQKVSQYEISREDCLLVQGGSFNPDIAYAFPNQVLNRLSSYVEEAEKPDE